MCGIAGWVDFERDLTEQAEMARAMTATMALRGPDDEGLWMSPHAAIGHRRLAVIDIEGGRQPMVSEDGQTVLTYSGEVYNYRELRGELTSAGHRFKTASDTEVVLRAYLEWGEQMVDRLNGMYAFAIWDARVERLLLVRDRLGIKPLFYYPLPNGVLFGSEPKAILTNPDAARRIDRIGLCGLLTGAPTPGYTPFAGLFELEPAHLVRISRDGIQKRQYWAIEAHPHEDDFPTTVAHVRELLEDIVTRQLVADVPRCVLLSGGVDSTAITALAQEQLQAAGETLRSFSVDFAGYAENFKPDLNRPAADGPFAHIAASHIGSLHQDIVLDTDDLFAPATRLSVLRAWDLPYHLADMDISLYLLFRAIRKHSTVALSGEGADEVFGGYAWIHDKEALELPLFPWMAQAIRNGARPLFDLFSPQLLEELGVVQYALDFYRDSVAEVPTLPGEEGEEKRMREVMYLHLVRWLRILLDRKDRMSMASGLEVRVPFCDHRLVEYVFNAPWSMKKADGKEKTLLRKAVEDVVPSEILQRHKVGFPATQDTQYDLGLRNELRRILDDGEPALPLLDPDATREAAEQPVGTGTDVPRLRLESVVRMNLWLKEYDVDPAMV
jgi:asparagine synthase (glutamine-hydrolysing)